MQGVCALAALRVAGQGRLLRVRRELQPRGRYWMGRDYLSVEVWDLNTQRRPVETHQARPWAPPPRPSCASMRSTSTFEASCVPSTMTASLTTPSAAGMAPTEGRDAGGLQGEQQAPGQPAASQGVCGQVAEGQEAPRLRNRALSLAEHRWPPLLGEAGTPSCLSAGCLGFLAGTPASAPGRGALGVAAQTRDQTSTPQRRGVRCNLSCQPSSSSAVSRPPPTRLRLPPARRPQRLCVRVSQAASLRCPGIHCHPFWGNRLVKERT
ncbi:hypothetical protein Celaphus_00008808, partial [Cervus elaphus hippelaphus]